LDLNSLVRILIYRDRAPPADPTIYGSRALTQAVLSDQI
jgi:hypothetical protein